MIARLLASLLVLSLLTPTDALAQGKKQGGQKGNQKKHKVQPHWDTEWYAEPQGGIVGWSSGGSLTTAATLGGLAGYRYWRVGDPPPRWSGQTRVKAAYVLSSANASGMEVRLGSFMGPNWKRVGIQAGPDLFWDQWAYGGTTLDPTLGLGVPAVVTLAVDPLTLWGGATPAWLSNPDRRVDWSQTDAPGFGHEFTWSAGASIRIDTFTLGVQYAYHIQATGVQQGFSFGVGLK